MSNIYKFLISSCLISSTSLAEPIFITKKAARAPASYMKTKLSQVPTFEIYSKKIINGKEETFKIKNIPKLEIGSERLLEAVTLSPLHLPPPKQLELPDVKMLPSPEVFEPVNLVVALAEPAKEIAQQNDLLNIPEVKTLEALRQAKTNQPTAQIQTLDEMKPNDFKLLQALIFLEKQNKYELAMGLFAELMDDPIHRLQALYSYAMTAKGLGLNSEFRHFMLQVAQESKDALWRNKASHALVNNIDVLEISDIALIDPLIANTDIDASTNDAYQIKRAKYYSDKGDLGQMEDSLLFIGAQSPFYLEALFIRALASYRQGKVDDAIVQLDQILNLTENNKKLHLRSLAAITVARMYFQTSSYKNSFMSYLKVDKSSSFWLQAMVESAWTQVMSEDYEGAAGNMFSLHTDFFKNAFAPESYVVRTVGYLNLCQFGDGAQVLKDMNKKYTPWKRKLDAYKISNRNYYDTVKMWIRNSDLKEVDGLPRSFIVELARHPAYINIQKQINNYEDEIQKFNKIEFSLLKMEREFISKKSQTNKDLSELKKKIVDTKVTEATKQEYALATKKLLSFEVQLYIAKKARNSIQKLRTAGVARIDTEKLGLRAKANMALQTHFEELSSSLSKFIDQNEILKYELFSGAGEHLRYQMAGGEISDKEHTELKVEESKQLNWKFKGEIWEDEVGHYRSSLKNVCPDQKNVAGNNDK